MAKRGEKAVWKRQTPEPRSAGRRQMTPAAGNRFCMDQPSLGLLDPSTWTILKVPKNQQAPSNSNIHSPSIFCSARSLVFLHLFINDLRCPCWPGHSALVAHLLINCADSNFTKWRTCRRRQRLAGWFLPPSVSYQAEALQTAASQSIRRADGRLYLQAAENQRAARQQRLQRYWSWDLWELKNESTCSQKHAALFVSPVWTSYATCCVHSISVSYWGCHWLCTQTLMTLAGLV